MSNNILLLDDPPSNTPSQRSTANSFTRPAVGNNYFNNRYPRNRSDSRGNNTINTSGNSKSFHSRRSNSDQGMLSQHS